VDLQITTETLTANRKLDFFANKHGWDATSSATLLISGTTQATHWPDGYVKPGTILAQFTSGGNSGLWAPWVQNDAGGLGLVTAAGIVFDGFEIRRDAAGVVIGTKTAGSIIRKGTPAHVFVAKLPTLLLTNGATVYTPTAADVIALGFVPETL
jgi:hypothetical protein